MRFCTVINRAWVAHARALAESVRTHHPQAGMSVLIVDPIEHFVDPTEEPFDVLAPVDLEVEDFAAMSVRYDVTGLCCALKPAILSHLSESEQTVVYLDSDVRLFAPLDDVEQQLETHPFLTTPHLLEPLPDDGRQPDELAILLAGSLNLGFAAVRSTPEVAQLLAWWSDRLRRGSRRDPEHGMVYDQRWADLMPGFSDVLGRWRDPGVNFGYWRAATSRLERSGDRVLVDGEPLRSFHFTGFDPRRPDRLSAFENRTSLEREPVLAELCGEYAERLRVHRHEETSRWPYGFATTAGGIELTPTLRELWDSAAGLGAVRATPFTPEGEREFLSWLGEPEPGGSGEPLSRYLTALHEASPDLLARFPDPSGADRQGYLAWAREQAERRSDGILAALNERLASAREPGLRRISPGERLPARRGDAVVCIPVYGAKDLFAECLSSVLAHTSPDVPILIADDASPDPAIESLVSSLATTGALAGHEVLYLRQPENLGFPGNVNAAFAACAPADVVVLNSDCMVAEGWLQGMRRAAYSDQLVATASALTNHGTILSVPERNRPQSGLPQNTDLDRAASTVLEQSLRLYPTLPTAIGHCMFVRRRALDLVGDFDLAFSPGYGEEVDFSQRCVLHGLRHVAADDVLVLHHSGASLGEEGAANPVQREHERIVEARYPYYQRAQTAAGADQLGPLPRALASARRSIVGFNATIDARCLGPVMTGTQVHTLEVIRALSQTGRLGIKVIVPPDIGGHAAAELQGMENVTLMPHTDIHPAMEKSDIAHRPYQVSNANDLLILSCVGERVLVTHQDLIAYRNPGYFPAYPHWERYRRLTREALAIADGVVFFSRHAAQDALKEDLVDERRVNIVYIGVDHAGLAVRPQAQQPPGVDGLAGKPMLLCLGTDFHHKNRVFALRLLEALRDEQSWDGTLVLAGPRVSQGSSAGAEATYLASRPGLRASVLTLPAVSEAEKAWLMEQCAAVLYPTTYEGFGLMPFEAASYDKPCLYAAQTALAETLPSELATLVPWDPSASAEGVLALLRDPQAAASQVHEIRRSATPLTWESAAEALVDVYLATAASPARDAGRVAADLALVEVERTEAERKYNELWESLTPDARALVAPDGPLTPSATHSLAAVARRPLLRRLLLGPIQLVMRIGTAVRRRPETPGPQTPPETFSLHFAQSNVDHMSEQLLSGDSERLTLEP